VQISDGNSAGWGWQRLVGAWGGLEVCRFWAGVDNISQILANTRQV